MVNSLFTGVGAGSSLRRVIPLRAGTGR